MEKGLFVFTVVGRSLPNSIGITDDGRCN